MDGAAEWQNEEKEVVIVYQGTVKFFGFPFATWQNLYVQYISCKVLRRSLITTRDQQIEIGT